MLTAILLKSKSIVKSSVIIQELEKKILAGNLSDEEEIFTYKYNAFDEKGNWTKKFEYKDGEIVSITIREIEY